LELTYLEGLLEQKKAVIVKNWFDTTMKTYKEDTAQFFKKNRDPFANPVGNTTLRGLEVLFDELLKDMDREVITSFLDPVIRIRAVQDFSPSQAVGFIIALKEVIREIIKKELSENQIVNDLLHFESRIDELSLIAFNIYMECRERIFHIKANEEKSKVFKAFSRAGLITEDPTEDPIEEPAPVIS
jgi:hypothetical protein